MGSEDLHYKRKQEAKRSHVRSKNRRAQYDVVLIVCEGEKTEPNYLEGLRAYLQLSTANIKLMGVGADPLSLVNYALKEFNKNKDYDRVYCVFDKDQHPRYQDALSKINSSRARKINSIPIHAITSVPCFEYWLLLHFVDSAKPYARAGNKSAGDQLCADIKVHIPQYSKGHQDIFNITKKNLQVAVDRAKKIDGQQEKNRTDNPTTKMYQLVEYLMSVKK